MRIPSYRLFRWLGTGLQVGGAIVLALNHPWSGLAYPFMLAGAITWATIAVLTGDAALAAMNVTFAMINCVGIYRWLL